MANYTDAIERFGVVTVFNATCVKTSDLASTGSFEDFFRTKTSTEVIQEVKAIGNDKKVYLDTLKLANITQEGPSKTITGGQYSNPLIKYGKTARCEMQDALGNANALVMLGGACLDSSKSIHITDNFPGPVTIVGDTFIVDQKSGDQVKINILIPQFLPDAVLSFNFDAEGDATVFDLNGDVLVTDLMVGTSVEGVFMAICAEVTEAGAGSGSGSGSGQAG